MNRVVKFRGKRCKDGEWVYGSYVESDTSWSKGRPHKSWILPSPMTNGGWFSIRNAYPVIDETVCQFTGLVDKNGNEIYEKDIIKAINYYSKTINKQKPKTGYIAWLAQECGFVIVWKEYDSRLGHRNRGSGYDYDNSIEVIGNVFDNPQLLKGGDNE